MEHRASCTLCPWVESWTSAKAGEAAAVWHVFDHHHDVWIQRIGCRLPEDSRPEDFGRKLEPWESQA